MAKKQRQLGWDDETWEEAEQDSFMLLSMLCVHVCVCGN